MKNLSNEEMNFLGILASMKDSRVRYFYLMLGAAIAESQLGDSHAGTVSFDSIVSRPETRGRPDGS